MAGSEVCQDIVTEEAVVQSLWEPRHEWEARVKFVEDYVADHGLEKAINLSLVWANMQFLGCRYPEGTESLVANYPVPSPDELRARRKCKNSVAKYKRELSNPAKPSFSEVSALISSLHTQSRIKATPLQLQSIANEFCLCKDCLGLSENESYSNKGKKILEHLQTKRKNFTHELVTEESGTWSLVLNGEVVLKRSSTEMSALEDFVQMLNNWQEANEKPSCPLVANQYQSGNGSAESDPWSHSDYSQTGGSNSGYHGYNSYGERQGMGRDYRQQVSRNWGQANRGPNY